ncbi:DNA translocase FtsK [Rhodovulum sp. DZ06]|uniref:DNA translocase FtsK n=1 Tax=Rhodovulum sp. DZ06 TaxID=3425126 RepID=UPI003D33D2C2
MGFSRSRPAPEELFSPEPEPEDAAAPRPGFLPPAISAALRRLGVQSLGILGIAGAGAFGALLWSWHPDDPSFLNATGAAAQNLLGAPGSHIADPMMRGLGLSAWAVPALLGAWGLRLVLRRGEGRIWSRLGLGAPVALPLLAAFASSNVPPAGWEHPWGLGGGLGDAILTELLPIIPLPLTQAMLALTLGGGALALTASGLALGLNGAETRAGLGWMGRGLARTSRAVAALAGGAGAAAARKAMGPRSSRLDAPEPVGSRRRDPELTAGATRKGPAPEAEELEEERGMVARLSALGGGLGARDRAEPEEAEAEMVPDEAQDWDAGEESPDEDRDAPRVVVSQSARRPQQLSSRAQAERQPGLALGGGAEAAEEHALPPISLLADPREVERRGVSDEALEENARLLEAVLDDYGIRGEIVSVRPGPVVTMYELEPAPGLKASRVISLADDIARSMSALAARVSTVPGRSIIGIELPNDHREKVLFRELVESRAFGDARDRLLLALGKDIGGESVITNLAKMPHLLIAGTTGSGKSVAINTMILSLLYRLTPKDCRLIMIDPKMLELSVYDGIPHLLSPVVTDPKKAVVALKWTVAEMEDRYKKMSQMGVRNIEGYNARVRDALKRGESFSRTVQTGFHEDTGEPIFETQEFEPEELPFIVVIVDEMADLMMVAGKEIEACIQRLAQMARASGIHLIMATQRPSVDVITGTIKANFPTRISFQVTSKIDSRTILGEQGAEQLLGMGDMLYMAGGGRITRVHGPFVSDEEVEEVVNHLRAQGQPDYVSGVTEGVESEKEADLDAVLGLAGSGGNGGPGGSDEELYDQAVAIVARERKCSTSYIQRRLSVGYQKAARLVDQMEEQGVVGPPNKVGKREIYVGEV